MHIPNTGTLYVYACTCSTFIFSVGVESIINIIVQLHKVSTLFAPGLTPCAGPDVLM